MSQVDQSRQETARNSGHEILSRLNEHGAATRIALELDVSEAAVSKWKSNEAAIGLEATAKLLAALGLKVVPADYLTIDPARYRALLTFAEEGFNALKGAEK